MKSPTPTAIGPQVTERHYCLKFGAVQGHEARIEVRDVHFECIGNCRVEDLATLAQLLGCTELKQEVLDQIHAMPHGKITPIKL